MRALQAKAATGTAALRQGPTPVVDIHAQLPVVPAWDREAGGAAIGFQAALTGFLSSSKTGTPSSHPPQCCAQHLQLGVVHHMPVQVAVYCVLRCCVAQSCFGVPTIILPSSALQPPLVEAFTPVLIQHLTAAGRVPGGQLAADTSCLEAHPQLTPLLACCINRFPSGQLSSHLLFSRSI